MTTKIHKHEGIVVFNFGPDMVATRDPTKVVAWYCREFGFADGDDAEFDPEVVDLTTIHNIVGAEPDQGQETYLNAIKERIQKGWDFPAIISSECY